MKNREKPTVIIEAGNTASAIVGFNKKEVPQIAKKVVKRSLNKKKKRKD